MSHHTEAINWFHMSLSRKRDDTITTSLLNHAMDAMIQQSKDENAKEETIAPTDFIIPEEGGFLDLLGVHTVRFICALRILHSVF